MAEPLKYTFYQPELFKELGERLKALFAPFDDEGFSAHFYNEEFREMELKEKMIYGARIIHQFLPLPYVEALGLLEKASTGMTGFVCITFPEFVAAYGLQEPERSLEALKVFTKLSSSEFGIRPFIDRYPKLSLATMLEWAGDDNEHVRRLASEGCRPRLPWGMALKKLQRDPAPILPILEKLRNDPSEYVRRSVANNLNDISKDHPNMVLELCESWQGESVETDKLIKHACRTLLKKGDTRAMVLFGFAAPDHVELSDFTVDNLTPKIGEKVNLAFKLYLKDKMPEKVRLEYKVHYVKANGKTSPKVFQIKEAIFQPGVTTVNFKQHFQNLTIRKHYVGSHKIELIVNGVVKYAITVDLKA